MKIIPTLVKVISVLDGLWGNNDGLRLNADFRSGGLSRYGYVFGETGFK